MQAARVTVALLAVLVVGAPEALAQSEGADGGGKAAEAMRHAPRTWRKRLRGASARS